MKPTTIKKQAFIFLLLLGFISLLSDFTHEGARSIYGPYLGVLGVSAFLVAFTAGLGEWIGQALRIVTGYIADKTKKYWLMMILGYALNLLVIPLLMFVTVDLWHVAIILILLERIGKGIRAPAKSALTSFTTPHLGVGKAFALQEAMDQFGAFLGPLFVFFILSLNKGSELNGYQMAFGLLGIFAVLTLVVLVIAKTKYPHPDQFETLKTKKGFKNNPFFMYYMMAIAFIAFGFIDYPVLAFHMGQRQLIDIVYIPLLYAMAMGVDAISALVFGHLYDRKGMIAVVISVFLSLFIAPVFFFVQGLAGLIIGILLWGIAMGAQESILKAVIASLVSKDKRGTAYGIFYTVFGSSWFLGSMIIGWLYQIELLYLVIFVSMMQGLALFSLSLFISKSKKMTFEVV